MAKNNPHKYDVNDVYNLLNENYVNDSDAITRADIQDRLSRKFNNGQWSVIMRQVRERAEKNNLTIPKAVRENGFTYKITDNPNDLIPGMIVTQRTISTLRDQQFKSNDFVKQNGEKLDNRLNGKVLKLINIGLDAEKLVEQALSVNNEILADAIDDRREMRKEDVASNE